MSKTTPPEATEPEQKNEIAIPTREELLAPIVAVEAIIRDALAACKELTVNGHADGPKAGYAVVSEHRKKLKKLRTSLETARTESKAPLLKLERDLDGEARRLTALIVPEESRLEKDEKAYEGIIAEEKRQKAQAAADRLASRLDAAKGTGALLEDIAMGTARDASDEEWATELARLTGIVALRRIERDRTDALDAVGADAPFGIGEWTEEEFNQFLVDATDDKKARDERADEANREAEAKREGERRSLLLAAQGVALSVEDCREMTPDDFAAALATAAEEKGRRDATAKAEADDLARLRREDAARNAAAAEKARKDAAERQRVEALRREESLRPDREALAKWRGHVLEAVQHAPTLADGDMCRLRDSVERAIIAAMDSIAFTESTPMGAGRAVDSALFPSSAVEDDEIELEF